LKLTRPWTARELQEEAHGRRLLSKEDVPRLTIIHLNFFHMIFNLVAVTPLIERFESEYGTLVTLALFTGRKQCTFQGLDT
jgi:hypothetical protein